MSRPRFLPDNFTLALIATVLLATFLPCSGQTAVVFEWVTNIGIGLLFFLHGAKLSRQAIIFQENPLGGIEYAVAGFLGFLFGFPGH